MKKRPVLLFLSSLFSLTLVFSVAELAVRCCTGRSVVIKQIESGNPFSMSDQFYLIRETTKGKRLVRNANVRILNHQLSGRDVDIKTNDQGFRYDTLRQEKDPSEMRVLFLGDSVTLDSYLPEDETFLRIAEQQIRDAFPTHTVKLINAGVEDIGLSEEIDILKEEGLSIHPDWIVVNFYLNDSRPPTGFDKELGHPGWLRSHSFALEWIYKRLKLSRWMSQQGENRMRWVNEQYLLDWRRNPEEFRKLTQSATFDWGAAWNNESWTGIEQQLKELQQLSREHHFSVGIVAFPTNFQLKTVFVDDLPQKKISELSKSLGFQFVDLLPKLREVNEQDDKAQRLDRKELFLDQAHLSMYGNRVVGEYLAEFLKRMLPK